jgi:hypothetical protein
MIRRTALGALLLLAAAAGCGPARVAAPPGPAAGERTLVRTELFFGRLRPGGVLVSDAEWRAFVAEHVTPRFPDGFTVVDGTGQYRDRAGRLVAEPSKILLIVHTADPRARAAIQELRDVYRRLFDQESVLLITGPAQVGF